MLAASIYEGYLERRYQYNEQKDLEVANNNHKPTVGIYFLPEYFIA